MAGVQLEEVLALASQINIDRGLNGYFEGSVDEICYGGVRLTGMTESPFSTDSDSDCESSYIFLIESIITDSENA